MKQEIIVDFLNDIADEMKNDLELSSLSNCKIPANYVRDYIENIECLIHLITKEGKCSLCPFFSKTGCKLDQNIVECEVNS